MIIDIDDVNKEEAEEKFRKVQNKENKKKEKVGGEVNMKKKLEKKSTIVITPIDFRPQEQSDSSEEKFNLRKSYLHSKHAKKEKEDYDETIRFGDRYPGKNKYYAHQHHPNLKNIHEPHFRYPEQEKETERNYIAIKNEFEVEASYSRRYKYYDSQGPRSRIVTSNEAEYYSPVHKFKKKS